MTVRRAFVLLSGGMDSTTCLYLAMRDFESNVGAVSIDYGQRHSKECEHAARICRELAIRHVVLSIPDLLKGAMLTDGSIGIPDVTYDQIKGVSPTYVPFRNGMMLSVLAAYAQKWINSAGPDEELEAGIYFGAHAEDAANWAYPDCTPEFIGAMANAIHVGTYYAVRLYTPVMWMMKHEIVTLGESLGVPWHMTWSCYAGGEKHCGRCPTCYARRNAFNKAKVSDPTVYAQPPIPPHGRVASVAI